MTVSEPREHKKQRKQKQLPVEGAVEETAKPKKSKKRKAEDVEAAIEDAGTEVKEKKKKRKEAVEGDPEVATDSADKLEKKKKRKHKEDGGLIVTSVGEEARDSQLAETWADAEASASGGKKRKREQSTLEEPEHHASGKKSKKSKDKKTHSAEHVGSDADDKKKKKKTASGETAGSSDKAAKKEKKSKKRRSTIDLPNPESDESLSDQARKALSYAFSQFSDPPNWKFNKARQNWLLRNIWSDKAIPETYLPLSIRYLANVQGGVRENLIKMSRTHLDAALPSEEAPIEAKAAEAIDGAKPDKDVDATDAQGTSPVDTGAARLRAQAILDALGAN